MISKTYLALAICGDDHAGLLAKFAGQLSDPRCARVPQSHALPLAEGRLCLFDLWERLSFGD